jgi:hypothetical protein
MWILCVDAIHFFILEFSFVQQQSKNPKWRSLDLENGAAAAAAAAGAGCGGTTGRPPFKTQRSSSMPTPKSSTSKTDLTSTVCRCTLGGAPGTDSSPCGGEVKERSTRGSVSNENNILLDPDVLTDYPTQALLLTVLVSIFVNLLRTFFV